MLAAPGVLSGDGLAAFADVVTLGVVLISILIIGVLPQPGMMTALLLRTHESTTMMFGVPNPAPVPP